MEEQKRRKEEAKKKDMETDLELERKLKNQRGEMLEREKVEIMKEGKRDLREFEDRPKRQVRRDQFATSDENTAAELSRHVEQTRQVEPSRPSITALDHGKFTPANDLSRINKPTVDMWPDPRADASPARLMDP